MDVEGGQLRDVVVGAVEGKRAVARGVEVPGEVLECVPVLAAGVVGDAGECVDGVREIGPAVAAAAVAAAAVAAFAVRAWACLSPSLVLTTSPSAARLSLVLLCL